MSGRRKKRKDIKAEHLISVAQVFHVVPSKIEKGNLPTNHMPRSDSHHYAHGEWNSQVHGCRKAESVPKSLKINNVMEEIIDLARQTNLDVDIDEVQELLDSHNQVLTIEELIEKYE
ncbi:hypothetical protein TNCV_2196541 [Trichonephila clavipes]|nr:hypothetical protein TNCV_2196541 [Trichonephila clavipes]